MRAQINVGKVVLAILVVLGLFNLTTYIAQVEPAYAKTEPEYTLQLAGTFPSIGIDPRVDASKKIKEIIEQKSNGKIKLDIYLDSQLGGDREIMEGCKVGDIAMVITSTPPQVQFIPELAVFDIAMLFDDLDVAKKALSGSLGEKTISSWYEKNGYKLLLFEPTAYRNTTTNKPIKSLSDFKGLKIRTMENKYHIAFWKALGANPTPLNFSELYIALQQGVVDAQENPYDGILSNKFYEVQKYIIETKHICYLPNIVMNKKLYDNMPAEYKRIIDDAMEEARNLLLEESKVRFDEARRELIKKGMILIEPADDVKQGMKNAAKEVEQMVRKDIGDDPVDSLMMAIKNAK